MGVDVAGGDGDSSSEAGPRRGLRGEVTRDGSQLHDVARELGLDEGAEAGRESVQELGRGVHAVLQVALVAGGAGVLAVRAAQLPHDPVGGFDEAPHRVVDGAVLLEQLQALRKLPLRRDESSVAGEPGLLAQRGECRDPVSLGLSGVVLPQLDVSVLVGGELLELAQWGSVVRDRDHRAGREVDADTDDVVRVDTGRGHSLGHGGLEDVDVVGSHLERPLRWQPLTGGS